MNCYDLQMMKRRDHSILASESLRLGIHLKQYTLWLTKISHQGATDREKIFSKSKGKYYSTWGGWSSGQRAWWQIQRTEFNAQCIQYHCNFRPWLRNPVASTSVFCLLGEQFETCRRAGLLLGHIPVWFLKAVKRHMPSIAPLGCVRQWSIVTELLVNIYLELLMQNTYTYIQHFLRLVVLVAID